MKRPKKNNAFDFSDKAFSFQFSAFSSQNRRAFGVLPSAIGWLSNSASMTDEPNPRCAEQMWLTKYFQSTKFELTLIKISKHVGNYWTIGERFGKWHLLNRKLERVFYTYFSLETQFTRNIAREYHS